MEKNEWWKTVKKPDDPREYIRVGRDSFYFIDLEKQIKNIGLPIEVQFKEDEKSSPYSYYFPFDIRDLEENIESIFKIKDITNASNRWLIKKKGKLNDITLIVLTGNYNQRQ